MQPHPLAEELETFRQTVNLFLIRARVEAAGALVDVEGDERTYYHVVILAPREVLVGDPSDIATPYRESFPLLHMAGFEQGDMHGDGVPDPASNLCDRVGQEVLVAVLLPDDDTSLEGGVEGVALSDVYGTNARPFLHTYGETSEAPAIVQAIRAVRAFP